MEGVQMVVLETDDLESQKNHMHLQVLEFSANQVYTDNNKNRVSQFKTIQKLKLVDGRFDEGMQPVAVEKKL